MGSRRTTLVLESTFTGVWSGSQPLAASPSFSAAHARELLRFSVNVLAANLAGFTGRRADALVLGIFYGPVAVGLYRWPIESSKWCST